MTNTDMPYRRLGTSGLQVSALSFGSWVTFDNQVAVDDAVACMGAARDAGVNFFDNAEAYGGGGSERVMGEALSKLGWKRESYVVSTKFFFGISGAPNMSQTLNRKYLLQAIDGSLERFNLDYIDLIFAHRSDPNTPMEEVVQAMSDIVASGKATYWGTSEWTSGEIAEAHAVAERHGLRAPVMEQPQYNILERSKVEDDYAGLYESVGLGLTTWSPLASGLLTGKYLDGVPDDSRGALKGYGWLRDMLTDEAKATKVLALSGIAEDLGCSLAQLSIAWCVANERVSTVITGASRASQVVENMGALAVLSDLDSGVLKRIDEAVGL